MLSARKEAGRLWKRLDGCGKGDHNKGAKKVKTMAIGIRIAIGLRKARDALSTAENKSCK